jgi:hypothetical protein
MAEAECFSGEILEKGRSDASEDGEFDVGTGTRRRVFSSARSRGCQATVVCQRSDSRFGFGEVPADFPTQARARWANVLSQLKAADMSVGNLVKVTMFLSSREFALPSRAIRQEVLGAHTPALTVIITGIFDERWFLEIEAVAAA